MSAREFDEHLENEGWMEEEDDANESLTFGNNVLNSSTIKRDKEILKSSAFRDDIFDCKW